MSRERSPSGIFIALFLAFLISALPAGTADTPAETTVATVQTTVVSEETTAPVTATTVVPPETTATTAPATVSATPTTVATTVTAATTETTVPAAETTAAPSITPSPATTTPVTLPATSAPPALTTPPVTAAVTTGSLTVYSSPPGAGILIDGIYSGTTPKTVQGIPAGNHILRLTLSGYHDYEGSVYIIAGQMAQGYGTLQPAGAPVSPAPVTPVIVPVVVPVVTDTPVPEDDTGIWENSGVLAAVIGAISVIIVSVAKVYTHIRPPKKEG